MCSNTSSKLFLCLRIGRWGACFWFITHAKLSLGQSKYTLLSIGQSKISEKYQCTQSFVQLLLRYAISYHKNANFALHLLRCAVSYHKDTNFAIKLLRYAIPYHKNTNFALLSLRYAISYHINITFRIICNNSHAQSVLTMHVLHHYKKEILTFLVQYLLLKSSA